MRRRRFLYRVDMRLRPWGREGELVVRIPAYLEYLKKQAELWGKAGVTERTGRCRRFCSWAVTAQSGDTDNRRPSSEEVRNSVRAAKNQIEAQLERRGRLSVKSNPAAVRFETLNSSYSYLQMIHGKRVPQIRSANTLDALVRLTDFDLIQADEYRCLTDGYVFLRTIEHSLQLLHNRQEHSLPTDPSEMTALARRLDFRDGEHLLIHYRRHCQTIRAVYDKYVSAADLNDGNQDIDSSSRESKLSGRRHHKDASTEASPLTYESAFTDDERREHSPILKNIRD